MDHLQKLTALTASLRGRLARVSTGLGHGNSDRKMLKAFHDWLDGIPEEIRFWHHYLAGRGGDFHEDFAFRLRPDTRISDRDDKLAAALMALNQPNIRLLDVGAGPLTTLGKTLPGLDIQITPCDPLADIYGILADRHAVAVPVRTGFADAEGLSAYFAPASFDAVHCSNALDHSYDPFGSILEMLKMVRPGGFVQLGHWENEGVHEKYGGLHQWNFTEENGDFVLWTPRQRLSLREAIGKHVRLDVWRIPISYAGRDWILVQMWRTETTTEILADKPGRLQLKYRLLRTLMGVREAGDANGHAADLASRYHALLRQFLEDRYQALAL